MRISKKLLESTEKGKIKAVTSTLTLVEIARSQKKFSESGSGTYAPGAFVRRALGVRNLTYMPLGGEMAFGEQVKVRIPLLFSAALKAVRTLPLKTLDLLQLASAYTAVRLFREDMAFFVTLDDGTLGLRREIKDFLGYPAVTPKELVSLEGI